MWAKTRNSTITDVVEYALTSYLNDLPIDPKTTQKWLKEYRKEYGNEVDQVVSY
jgi:hypothetical protein